MTRAILPCFELVVDCPEQVVADCLARRLGACDCQCIGWVAPPYAELHVPASLRHFWSPRLQVTLDAVEHGTLIRCTYRPEPEVWTGFVFVHCLSLTIGMVGLCLGLAQWSLGQPPLALIAGAVGPLISGSLYTGALLGQGLGHAQMQLLRRDFDHALAETGAAAPANPAA